ncbi:MAG: STAS domain-containing protein [Saprospiraceae bacterium]
MKYIIQQQHNLQILYVDNLMYETENRNLLNKLSELINDGKNNLVVSLNQVQFLNSTGLRFLISLLTKTRNSGGDTVLIHVPEQVRKLLVMTKLQSIFPIFDSLDNVKAAEVFEPQQAFSDSESIN